MKKKMLSIIIGLICLSALGIIAVQLFWIRNAIQVKEAQFNRSVNEALGAAVSRLETKENLTFLSRNDKKDSLRIILQSFVNDTLTDWQKRLQTMTRDNFPSPPPPPQAASQQNHSIQRQKDKKGNTAGQRANQPQRSFSYSGFDPADIDADQEAFRFFQEITSGNGTPSDTFVYQVPSVYGNFEYKIIIDHDMRESSDIFLNPETFQLQNPDVKLTEPGFLPPDPGKIQDQLDKLNKKTRRIQDIVRRMAIELETQPKQIITRIDSGSIRKALQQSLADKDISMPFEFAVLSPGNDSLPIPFKTRNFQTKDLETEHRVSLFPNDIFRKPELLLVSFPGEKTHALKSVSWLMAGSSLFILFILLTSGLSIYFMIRQKRISDIKTDFINNMTHEFKTPIATISIAADSINNPKVISDPDSVKSYTRIIKEENSRMNTRVEQVLQMALLDSRDFSLKKAPVDLQELLTKLASNLRLQVEKYDGTIELKFQASRLETEGDESHLANVFLALFDNAIKYSAGRPEITVETKNTGDNIQILFSDKGIGMTKETMQKVFDKFYRVTHGNIHNVKGFGLGLSYAKAIILAHGGTIKVDSELNKGSTFEITLPVI